MHYAGSRATLCKRMRAAGLQVLVVRGPHDRRVVVVASEPIEVRVVGPRPSRSLKVGGAS